MWLLSLERKLLLPSSGQFEDRTLSIFTTVESSLINGKMCERLKCYYLRSSRILCDCIQLTSLDTITKLKHRTHNTEFRQKNICRIYLHTNSIYKVPYQNYSYEFRLPLSSYTHFTFEELISKKTVLWT